jgi:hypothetical protein
VSKYSFVPVLAAALLVSAPVVASAAEVAAPPAFVDVHCSDVDALEGYVDCVAPFGVRPGYFVRVGVTSAGGKTVRFRAYNFNGDHLLGEGVDQREGGNRSLVWRNDTNQVIQVELKVDLRSVTGSTNVNARAHITTF